MPFNESTWVFPKDQLQIVAGYLCVRKDESGAVSVLGARLECAPARYPNINWAYEKDSEERLNIYIDFEIPFAGLDALAGTALELGEPVEQNGDDLGSVYLFGAHNPVGWQTIRFGAVQESQIAAYFDLYFDFDFEDRIGGCFRKSFDSILILEKRWEL